MELRRVGFLAALSLLSLGLSLGCVGDGMTPPGGATLTITPNPTFVTVGADRLILEVRNEIFGLGTPAEAMWMTSDPAIATVSAGVIRGVGPGTTSIIGSFEYGTTTYVGSTEVRVLAPLALATAPTMASCRGTTCALATDGRAICWGACGYGTCGRVLVGAGIGEPVPTPVDGDVAFTTIALGAESACGVGVDGATYCWGTSSLGRGTPSVPVVGPSPVIGPERFVRLAAGLGFVCGLTAEGALFCWGDVPRAVNPELRFVSISARDSSLCGLTAQRVLYCGTAFELFASRARDAQVWESMSAGTAHQCMLDEAGTAFCWGEPGAGQLGHSRMASDCRSCETCPPLSCVPDPYPVDGDLTFASISAGQSHTCALTPEGVAYCWGENQGIGAVGDGTDVDQPAPRAVTGGHTFASILAGYAMSCGITPEGQMFCWGNNNHGEVGDGNILLSDQTSEVRAVIGGYTFLTGT